MAEKIYLIYVKSRSEHGLRPLVIHSILSSKALADKYYRKYREHPTRIVRGHFDKKSGTYKPIRR